jgi:transposase
MRQWRGPFVAGIMQRMLGMRDLHTQDLQGLAPEAVAALAAQLLGHIRMQGEQLALKDQALQTKTTALQAEIERKDREIAWRDAKLEKLNVELAAYFGERDR